jgi:hypothetical protein
MGGQAWAGSGECSRRGKAEQRDSKVGYTASRQKRPASSGRKGGRAGGRERGREGGKEGGKEEEREGFCTYADIGRAL